MEASTFAWPTPDLRAMSMDVVDPSQWMTRLMKPWSDAMPMASAGAVGGIDTTAFKIDPARLLELQNDYAREWSTLWSSWAAGKHAPFSDKRFGSEAWSGPHGFIADLYLLNARFINGMAEAVEADAKTRAKIRFAVQQWVDAMAPSN